MAEPGSPDIMPTPTPKDALPNPGRRKLLKGCAIGAGGVVIGIPTAAGIGLNWLKNDLQRQAIDMVTEDIEAKLTGLGEHQLTEEEIAEIYAQQDETDRYSTELLNAVRTGTPAILDGKAYAIKTALGEQPFSLTFSQSIADSVSGFTAISIDIDSSGQITPVITLTIPSPQKTRDNTFMYVVEGQLYSHLDEVPAKKRSQVDTEGQVVANLMTDTTWKHESFHGATFVQTIIQAAKKIGLDISALTLGENGEHMPIEQFAQLSPEERKRTSYRTNQSMGNISNEQKEQLTNALLQPYNRYALDSARASQELSPLAFSDEPRAYFYEACEMLKSLKDNQLSIQLGPGLNLRQRLDFEKARLTKPAPFPYHRVTTPSGAGILIPAFLGLGAVHRNFGPNLQAANNDWGKLTAQHPRFSDFENWRPYSKEITSFYSANAI